MTTKQQEEIREKWLKTFYGNSWSADSIAKYWLSILDQELAKREEQSTALVNLLNSFKVIKSSFVKKGCVMVNKEEFEDAKPLLTPSQE